MGGCQNLRTHHCLTDTRIKRRTTDYALVLRVIAEKNRVTHDPATLVHNKHRLAIWHIQPSELIRSIRQKELAVAERPHEQQKDRLLILVLPRENGMH
jgi:hypothetical protein